MNILLYNQQSQANLDNIIFFKKNAPVRHSFYGNFNLEFLTLSELTKYFKLVNLKVPNCFDFSSTVSSKRIVNSVVILSKYLMYSGLLWKCVSQLNSCMNLISRNQLTSYTKVTRSTTFYNLSNKLISKYKYSTENLIKPIFFNKLNYQLRSLKPLFHFYIYKVDKQIYKNSRGKSGKYTFLWKYIQPFKRSNFLLSKLAKDIRFDSAKTLNNRIMNIFLNYSTSINKTFIYKSIRFSNNYVFFNSKNTLLQNYKTTKSL